MPKDIASVATHANTILLDFTNLLHFAGRHTVPPASDEKQCKTCHNLVRSVLLYEPDHSPTIALVRILKLASVYRAVSEVHDGVSAATFVEMRSTRDATLSAPKLI